MRHRSALLASVAMGAVMALAQDYRTPSFDCANTTTAQELRICRSPELSELDGRLGALVERAIRASTDRDKTRAEMDAWLESARNPCQTDACLVEAYSSRIRELERVVPAVDPQPAITAPMRRDLQPVPAGGAATPNPAVPESQGAPEPASDEDDEEREDGDWADAAMLAALAALAAAVGWIFRTARHKRVSAGGARDASGDRP